MKDCCKTCFHSREVGYNTTCTWCDTIECFIKDVDNTICDKYSIDPFYKSKKEREKLREKLNFRNID